MGLFKKNWIKDVKISITGPSDSELRAALHKDKGDTTHQKRRKISSNRTENEVFWHTENDKYNEAIRKGDIGTARNHLLSMANIREHEGDLIPALLFYFNVCYWDLSGFSSLEEYRLGLEENFKICKPSPFLAPGVIRRIAVVRKKLNLSDADLMEKFMSDDLSSSVPCHLFSQDKCADLVLESLSNGVDPVNDKMESAVRSFIRNCKNQKKK